MTTLPQIHGQDLLTHSRMQCKKQCARKHHYRYNLGVRKDTSAKPLRMGTAIHIGREHLALGHTFEVALDAAVRGYEELPVWARTEEGQQEWMVERETVAALLAGYQWYWDNTTREQRLIAEDIKTEFHFEHDLRNPDTGAKSRTYRIAGKIDGIVRLYDHRLAVYELKSTGDDIGPESDYWARLNIDQQISLYMLAAQRSGHEVETVIYDVIRKPSIAPRQIPLLDADGLKIVLDADWNRVLKVNIKKNGEPGVGHGEPRQSGDTEKGWVLQTRTETHQEFGERLLQDISDRPEFYFQRREIPRLRADLDEFEAELWQQSQDIRESLNTGRHFRNTNACTVMGTCEYLSICHNGIDPGSVPDGFRRVETVHPELQGDE